MSVGKECPFILYTVSSLSFHSLVIYFIFQYFVHHPSSVNLTIVLQDAYRMQEATPTDIHPKEVLGEFIPLTKGTYPVFNKYPEFIVDYQVMKY